MREARAALRAPVGPEAVRPARLRIRGKRAAGLDRAPVGAHGSPGGPAVDGSAPLTEGALSPATA
eukprot:14484943-Alexandrium_andersonii.AAC.1